VTATDIPPVTPPEEAEAETEEEERSVLSHLGSFARELGIIVLGAIIVSTLLRVFVGQMFMIPSPSMEGTLLVGDRVVVQKVKTYQRGDIVVFGDPGGWLGRQTPKERGTVGKVFEFIGLAPNNSTGHFIKRVIGLPGDKVICCDAQGKVTVNGQPLDETAYLYRDASGKQVNPSDFIFEVIVPKDKIFVMGDHRDESSDSRCHLADEFQTTPKGSVAFVPKDLVVGETFAVIAPFNRAKRLHTPETFSTVPTAAQAAPDQPTIKLKTAAC
jgi:signal peptidase I